VAYDGRPVMKLSAGKVTMPSAKQVYRSQAGSPDLLALRDEAAPPGREALLVPVMRGGRRIRPPDEITLARERFERDLGRLPPQVRTLTDPRPPAVTRSDALRTLTAELSRRLDRRAGSTT